MRAERRVKQSSCISEQLWLTIKFNGEKEVSSSKEKSKNTEEGIELMDKKFQENQMITEATAPQERDI